MSLTVRLKTFPVFSELNQADLALLAASVTEREYAPGDCIWSEGDDADQLLLLASGQVALQVLVPGSAASARVTVDLVTESQVFGWAAIMEPHVHTTSAICLRTTSILLLDGVVLRSLMQDERIGYAWLHECAMALTTSLAEARAVLASERLLMPLLQESNK
jgi:CRP/FNR family cyclic AMP-dependent transcriptional regulator